LSVVKVFLRKRVTVMTRLAGATANNPRLARLPVFIRRAHTLQVHVMHWQAKS
jgi:hypothetical protein